MGPTERAIPSTLDKMRETGADPRAGRSVPIESVYEANTITRDQYRAILDEWKQDAAIRERRQVAYDGDAESYALRERMVKAGFPRRYVDCSIDTTHVKALGDGMWLYVTGQDVDAVTRKASAMAKGWVRSHAFGTMAFERATTAISAFMGDDARDSMVRLSTVGLLVLSGLGSENASGWAVSKLGELLDTRFGNELPTIVTTRHRPDELAGHLCERGGEGNASGIMELLRRQCVLVAV